MSYDIVLWAQATVAIESSGMRGMNQNHTNQSPNQFGPPSNILVDTLNSILSSGGEHQRKSMDPSKNLPGLQHSVHYNEIPMASQSNGHRMDALIPDPQRATVGAAIVAESKILVRMFRGLLPTAADRQPGLWHHGYRSCPQVLGRNAALSFMLPTHLRAP
ncbi:MAG: hypothetical protein Q9203_000099 [Teloschistes exilis]